MPRTPVPLWLAVLTAAASGPVMDAGFPDKDIWPLTFLGIGLVLLSLIGRRAGSALLVGFVAGMAFYLVHITWATEFLGDVLPFIALATLESLFFALGSLAISLAYRWVPRAYPGTVARLTVLTIAVAGLWTAREALISVWPYGGFAWGRVALSQSMSPLADLFAWLGVSGVSFVMVLLVAVVIELARLTELQRLTRATVAIAAIAAVFAVPAFPVMTEGSLRVAAVQGNGKAAYIQSSERQYGDLLNAQLAATGQILKNDPGVKVDVVLWPEGGTDVDPIENPIAAQRFDQVSQAFNAPFISGAITTDGTLIWNSSILWVAGEGVVDKYDKRHPVPFGEYIPDRAFWRPFAPDLIDLVQREYTPGTTDSVFRLGDVTVGVNICFDIVDDQLMTESVENGAQVIFAQSNNADFGHSDESLQQLAIARIRALELGRSVVNISTVGTSAIILPDGSELDSLPTFTAGSMVDTVPLSTVTTPAVFGGRLIEWIVSAFGLLALLFGALIGRRARD